VELRRERRKYLENKKQDNLPKNKRLRTITCPSAYLRDLLVPFSDRKNMTIYQNSSRHLGEKTLKRIAGFPKNIVGWRDWRGKGEHSIGNHQIVNSDSVFG